MKDWKEVKLTPLSPQDRALYTRKVMEAVRQVYDPIEDLYRKYKKLPADVAARLIDLDRHKPGWDSPPQYLINSIAANLHHVRMLFALCAVDPETESEDYVDESNRAEVYGALLKLLKEDDLKKQARAAADFCKSTQGGLR